MKTLCAIIAFLFLTSIRFRRHTTNLEADSAGHCIVAGLVALFATLVAFVFVTLLTSCAHAEPLPVNVPPGRLIWNPVPGAVIYRPYFLTNSAPDFALGTNSVNWTPLPDTQATNAIITNAPANSLLIVSVYDGAYWSTSAAVTNAVTAPAVVTGLKAK